MQVCQISISGENVITQFWPNAKSVINRFTIVRNAFDIPTTHANFAALTASGPKLQAIEVLPDLPVLPNISKTGQHIHFKFCS